MFGKLKVLKNHGLPKEWAALTYWVRLPKPWSRRALHISLSKFRQGIRQRIEFEAAVADSWQAEALWKIRDYEPEPRTERLPGSMRPSFA